MKMLKPCHSSDRPLRGWRSPLLGSRGPFKPSFRLEWGRKHDLLQRLNFKTCHSDGASARLAIPERDARPGVGNLAFRFEPVFRQIAPRRIERFDQRVFLCTAPALQLLLTGDCTANIVVTTQVDVARDSCACWRSLVPHTCTQNAAENFAPHAKKSAPRELLIMK